VVVVVMVMVVVVIDVADVVMYCVVLWRDTWSASLADESVSAADRLWKTLWHQSWGWWTNSAWHAGLFVLCV